MIENLQYLFQVNLTADWLNYILHPITASKKNALTWIVWLLLNFMMQVCWIPGWGFVQTYNFLTGFSIYLTCQSSCRAYIDVYFNTNVLKFVLFLQQIFGSVAIAHSVLGVLDFLSVLETSSWHSCLFHSPPTQFNLWLSWPWTSWLSNCSLLLDKSWWITDWCFSLARGNFDSFGFNIV